MNDNNNKHQQRQVNEVLRAMIEKFSSNPFCQVAKSALNEFDNDTPGKNDVYYHGPISEINSALYDAGVDVKNPSDPWDEVLEYLTETPKKIKSLLMLLDEKDKRIRELESDLRIRNYLDKEFNKFENNNNNHSEENTDNSDSSSN